MTDTAIRPFEPPLWTADLPAPGGVVAQVPEHFCVDEIPSYEPCGEGPHWYVRIRKRGLTTQDAVRRIARAAGVERKHLGVAGQKDKHAVTTQWVSIPEKSVPPAEWDAIDRVEVLDVSRHTNRLKVGHLKANRFTLTFSELGPDAGARFGAVVERLRATGVPNYFGPQRFGTGQRNLEEALDWLERGAPLKGMHARFKKRLLPSVLQSEVFNRYISQRLADERPLLEGEVVRLDGSRSLFVVQDPAAELPRLREGDIHRTGPMFGPKCRRSEGEVFEAEAAAARSLGLTNEARRVLGKMAPGARRDLLVNPQDLEYRSEEGRAVLTFTLPSGSYATQLAREFTRLPWTTPLRP